MAESEEELVRRARQLYDQKLRVLLEPNQQGRYVPIEPDTGRYFPGDTGTAALVEAHTSMPKLAFISPELASKPPIFFTAMASTSGKIISSLIALPIK